ncbi:hypothetical protein [Ruminococcus sp.]|uniref:hypothetical protein n=1 Tax=Ruminococcus sp. TaxID=41978 RepID=UPI0025D18874|nr:hypothetical protein [Ruminococcus sp.]
MKELFKYIKSDEYRNWLIENGDKLNNLDFVQLINCAQIDIHEKLALLGKYKDELMNDDGEPWKCYEAARNSYEIGIRLLEEESDDALFQVTSKSRVNQNYLEYTEDNTWPCKTFKEVMDYVLGIDEDYDQPFDMDEIDEFDDFWYIVERYTLCEGKYGLDAWFCMSAKGKVWSVDLYSESPVVSGIRHRDYFVDYAGLKMPMPYKEGDILTVDCRPFHAPYHAVVIWVADNIYECCSPGCLRYITERGSDRVVSARGIKHYYTGYDEFSPLINVSLYEGELPEDEKLIRQVSEYIKTHEGSAKVIEEMEFRLADFEEGLTRLVENDITLDEMKRILSESKDKYDVKL